MTITVPSELWSKYEECCDFFLTDSHLSSSCTLVYPSRKIPCDNCVTTNIGGTSTNSYRHGGLAPFSFGSCPLCGGSGGYHEEEITGTIRLRIYWDKKSWIKISEINFPNTYVQTIGYMTDEPKMRKANEIILLDHLSHLDIRTVLAGPTLPHGFGKSRYFIAHLKRV